MRLRFNENLIYTTFASLFFALMLVAFPNNAHASDKAKAFGLVISNNKLQKEVSLLLQENITLSKQINDLQSDLSNILLKLQSVDGRVSILDEKDDELAKRLSTIDRRVDQVESRQMQSGAVFLEWRGGSHPQVGRSLIDNTQCPKGEDAFRGVISGQVNFKKKFAKKPEVIMALNDFQIGTGENNLGTNRIRLEVLSIDRDGFTFSFGTWCTTQVWDAHAVWIAFD